MKINYYYKSVDGVFWMLFCERIEDINIRVFITYAKKLDKLSHEQQKSTAPSPAPPRYLIHAFSTSEGSIKSRGGRISQRTLHFTDHRKRTVI